MDLFQKLKGTLTGDDTEVTLLTIEQAIGDEKGNGQLEVLKKYGNRTAVSDLAILLGGYIGENNEYIPEDESLKGRSALTATQSIDCNGYVQVVDKLGLWEYRILYNRVLSIRPVLATSSIFNKIYPNRIRGYNETEEVIYGEYPQYAPEESIQRILESKYQNGNLKTTGKKYTFDKTAYDFFAQSFQAVIYKEYEYNGRKYIRVKARSCYDGAKFKLSNGQKYRDGDYVWVEVSPIKWLIDNENKLLISKISLLSGINFHNDVTNYNINFSKTEMYKYLNTHFIKEIIPSRTTTISKNIKLQEEKTLSPMETNLYTLKKEIEELIKTLPEESKNKIKNEYNNIIEEFNSNQLNPLETNINLNLSLNTYSLYSLYNRLLELKNKLINQEELLTFFQEIASYEAYLENNKGMIKEYTEYKSIEDILSNIIALTSNYNLSKEQESIIYNHLNNYFANIKNQKTKELNNLFDHRISLSLIPVTTAKDKLREYLLNFYKDLENTLQVLEPSLKILDSLKNNKENPQEIKTLADNISSLKHIVNQSNLTTIQEQLANITKKYQEIYQTFIEETLKTNNLNQENQKDIENELRQDLLNFINQNMETISLEENKNMYKKMLEATKDYIDSNKYAKLNIYLSYTIEILANAKELTACGNYDLIIDSLKNNLDSTLSFVALAKTNNELNSVLKNLENKLLALILITIPNLKTSEIETTTLSSLKLSL